MDLEKITYGIAGLGIMGGSIAKAIRKNILCKNNAEGKIIACDKNEVPLKKAKSQGIVDEIFTSENTALMLEKCDIVYICLYPHAVLNFLSEYKNAFKSGSIITDISGVKNIFEINHSFIIRSDIDFIVGHPMAGGEKEGYENSSADFFCKRNYILIPQVRNKIQNLETMRTLIKRMGFSRITETDCKNHDRKIAFTSQLCHIIASALVESAEDEQITAFGGGSFEDLTRIAMINAPLWTELFLLNKKELLNHINSFQNKLEEFKECIEKNNAPALQALLEETRNKRMNMALISRMTEDENIN